MSHYDPIMSLWIANIVLVVEKMIKKWMVRMIAVQDSQPKAVGHIVPSALDESGLVLGPPVTSA